MTLKPSDTDLLVGALPKRLRGELCLNPRVFALLLKPIPKTGCMEWTRGVVGAAPNNYGYFSLHGKRRLAHRHAWELANGPIAPGIEVCHSCDNPKCCNAEHLFLGTHAENMKDMKRKGRAAGESRPGIKSPMAKLSESQVGEIRMIHEAGVPGIRSDRSTNGLARRFGVSRAAIWKIVSGKGWAHLA